MNAKTSILKFRSKTWRITSCLISVIDHLVTLIKEPDASDAINAEVAKVMKESPTEFSKKAKEWTEQYAQ